MIPDGGILAENLEYSGLSDEWEFVHRSNIFDYSRIRLIMNMNIAILFLLPFHSKLDSDLPVKSICGCVLVKNMQTGMDKYGQIRVSQQTIIFI
jgi:hypothetical protein